MRPPARWTWRGAAVPELVTLEEAKTHLRILGDAEDVEVRDTCDRATAIILDYLKDSADPTWTHATVPAVVVAAILLMLAHLYEHRGDDFAPDDYDKTLWEAIARVLMRSRDPALA